MRIDLIQGPLKDERVKTLQIQPGGGRTVLEIGGGA